jgi:ADP-ribose pyrophosphatase
MIKRIVKLGIELGINYPLLGRGMSLVWETAKLVDDKLIPGRYRAAMLLSRETGFLRIKKDGIYNGERKIPVHPAVCKELLLSGILQIRIKGSVSFEEALSFLNHQSATAHIKINMAIAPELVQTWRPNLGGSSPAFKAEGTFPISERLPIFLSPLFNVRLEEVKLPNGVATSWLTIDTPDAVEVVPVTKDGKIILIQQPRHTAPLGWEVPAGVLEKGVAPEHQALVELEEEAGFKAKQMVPLANYYIFVGSANQVMKLYLARDLTEVGQKLEEHESILNVKAFSQKEIWEMINNGQIRDSHTLVAVMLAMHYLNK